MLAGASSALARCQPAPSCDHHDALVGVASRDFVEKQLHAGGVDMRQDEAVGLARADVHGAVGIGVLVREHGLAQRSHGLRCPAAADVRDAAKARLVLEHQADRAALCPAAADVLERLESCFSTPPAPPHRSWDDACRAPASSSRGGAAGCRRRPAPPGVLRAGQAPP